MAVSEHVRYFGNKIGKPLVFSVLGVGLTALSLWNFGSSVFVHWPLLLVCAGFGIAAVIACKYLVKPRAGSGKLGFVKAWFQMRPLHQALTGLLALGFVGTATHIVFGLGWSALIGVAGVGCLVAAASYLPSKQKAKLEMTDDLGLQASGLRAGPSSRHGVPVAQPSPVVGSFYSASGPQPPSNSH